MGPDRRRSIRLPGFDYASPGAYFVTVCSLQRRPLFGEVVNDQVRLSPLGAIAVESWQWLSAQYPYVALDEWILMPNHLHAILILREDITGARRGGSRAAPTTSRRKPLGELMGAFKTVSTKRINVLRGTPGEPVWQRGYYEHVIRGEAELKRARNYIVSNPIRWAMDRENLARGR
jgi:REP element-mobilizing transposase RayT